MSISHKKSRKNLSVFQKKIRKIFCLFLTKKLEKICLFPTKKNLKNILSVSHKNIQREKLPPTPLFSWKRDKQKFVWIKTIQRKKRPNFLENKQIRKNQFLGKRQNFKPIKLKKFQKIKWNFWKNLDFDLWFLFQFVYFPWVF